MKKVLTGPSVWSCGCPFLLSGQSSVPRIYGDMLVWHRLTSWHYITKETEDRLPMIQRCVTVFIPPGHPFLSEGLEQSGEVSNKLFLPKCLACMAFWGIRDNDVICFRMHDRLHTGGREHRLFAIKRVGSVNCHNACLNINIDDFCFSWCLQYLYWADRRLSNISKHDARICCSVGLASLDAICD